MMLARIVRLERELANVARVAGGRIAFQYAGSIVRTFPEVMRSGTLDPADAIMQRRKELLRVDVEGVRLKLPAECFGGMREMYARRVYTRLPGFRIRRGDTVIDLGCNQGLFTLLAAKIGAKVIALDAQAGFREALAEHLERNGCAGRVTFVPGLLGGSTGLLADESALVSSSHYNGKPEIIDMAELTADIDTIDFLKVDIEGAEFDVFTGTQPWIAKVARIAMEVHAEFGEPGRLSEWLSCAGFELSSPSVEYIYGTRRKLA